MKLNLNNRDVKYFPGVKDITMVEIQNYYPIKILNFWIVIITIRKDLIIIKIQLLLIFNII